MVAVLKNFNSEISSFLKENERNLLDYSGIMEISRAKPVQVKVMKYMECIPSGQWNAQTQQ